MTKAKSTNDDLTLDNPLTLRINQWGKFVRTVALASYSITTGILIFAFLKFLNTDLPWLAFMIFFPMCFFCFKIFENFNELSGYQVNITHEGLHFGGKLAQNFMHWRDIQSVGFDERFGFAKGEWITISKRVKKQRIETFRGNWSTFPETFYIPSQLDIPSSRVVRIMRQRLRNWRATDRAARLAEKEAKILLRQSKIATKRQTTGTA